MMVSLDIKSYLSQVSFMVLKSVEFFRK